MPRRLDATWAEWEPPEGFYRRNPPEPVATIYRRDRNGFKWFRIVRINDWVTLSEAASILKVNPATAWQWSRKGAGLPTRKGRGTLVVRFSDVVKVAEERGIAPTLTKGHFFRG